MERGRVGPSMKRSAWQPPPAAPQPAAGVGPDPAQAQWEGAGANVPDFPASAWLQPTAPDEAWGLLRGPGPQNLVSATLPPPSL